MRQRAATRSQVWKVVAIVIALVLVCVAVVYQLSKSSSEQRQAHVAEQLTVQPTSQPSLSPIPTPSLVPTPSASLATPETASPVAHPPEVLADTQPVLPVARFKWPAAGMDVSVVPMDWRADQWIDPPLDANGLDPVGHWLKGTGELDAYRPIVVAAHTCYVGYAGCNDQAFPFNRLSFPGWKVGQPASIIDATGRQIDYTLVRRQLVDKSKAFEFANDKCLLVAFTCNIENPDGEITLVTFRRTGCEA